MGNETLTPEITLESFESQYRPILDAVGQIINANPDLTPEGFDAVELAVGIQAVGNAAHSLLTQKDKALTDAEKRAAEAEARAVKQTVLAHQYYLLCNQQSNRMRDLEAGIPLPAEHADKEASWEDIQKIIDGI